MNKSDLEVFDVVKLRDGKVLMVLPNDDSESGGLATYSIPTCGCHCYLSNYDDNLEHICNMNFDIVQIHKSKGYAYTSIRKLFVDSEVDFVWDLERRDPKKMTMADLEKALGYPVEIVKE